jgi:uncharacterized protein YfiM (DUF2279 family)
LALPPKQRVHRGLITPAEGHPHGLGAGLSTPATAFQLAYDDWSGPDKSQHMLEGVYGGAAATQFVRTYTNDATTAVLWGAVIGQMPGLMRETMQGFQESGFSYKDHAFNVAGAVFGALLQQNNRPQSSH